jgi:hypothetical protein
MTISGAPEHLTRHNRSRPALATRVLSCANELTEGRFNPARSRFVSLQMLGRDEGHYVND